MIACDHGVTVDHECFVCEADGQPSFEPFTIAAEAEPVAVRVEWIDSGMSHGRAWQPPAEYVKEAGEKDVMRCVSIGWLLHRDSTHLILAQSWDRANDNYINAQTIYAPCVLKVETL